MTRTAERIVVSAVAWTTLLTAASRDRLHETGGILLGWRGDGDLYVSSVTEVPDREVHRASYRRRYWEAEGALRQALAELPPDSPVGYVGEWHTHPAPVGPSCSDRRELKRFSKASGGRIGMIVCAYSPGPDNWIPHGVTAVGGRLSRAAVETEEGGNDE